MGHSLQGKSTVRKLESPSPERLQPNVTIETSGLSRFEALELAAAKSRVGLVTNTLPEMQRPKLESLGIENDFEVCVFAGYDTKPKPSTELFEYAFDAVDAEPSQPIHIGDSLRGDIGRWRCTTVGLNTVFVGEQSSVEESDATPDLAVESMGELAALLRG